MMKTLLLLLPIVALAQPQQVSLIKEMPGGTFGTVATPTVDNDTGQYSLPVSLTFSEATSGATLYTCSNSGADCTPTTGTTNPVTVSVTNTHVCAVGRKPNYTDSAAKCATITQSTAITVVQSCAGGGSGSFTCDFGSSVTAGHKMVVYVGRGTTPAPTNGSCAATWTLLASDGTGVTYQAVYTGTASGGTCHLSFNAGGDLEAVMAVELSATSITSDATPTFAAASGDPPTGPNITTSTDGSLVLGFVNQASGTITAINSPFSQVDVGATPNWGVAYGVGSYILTSHGTTSMSWTNSYHDGYSAMVAFK
jgi:hypothetical protein